jgi:hypothetical protein
MEEVIDLIATDSPASQVTDKIKELLFAKAAEKVDAARPIVATSLFGGESEGEIDSTEDEE